VNRWQKGRQVLGCLSFVFGGWHRHYGMVMDASLRNGAIGSDLWSCCRWDRGGYLLYQGQRAGQYGTATGYVGVRVLLC